jgi:hypothetical protein
MSEKLTFKLTCAGCKYAVQEIPVPQYAKVVPSNVKEWARPLTCNNPDGKYYKCWLNVVERTGNLVPRVLTERCKLYELNKGSGRWPSNSETESGHARG